MEDYLKTCLDSLVNQTLKNIEIIAVNDGSTDSSKDILNEYVCKYSNIKLINKSNGGVASARNLGIENAQGEYIGFVDSDDFVQLDMYERMYNRAIESNSDIVICKFRTFEDEKELNNKDINKSIYTDYSHDEIIKKYLKDEISGYVVDKIVKLEIIRKNNIKFPENTFGEDMYPSLIMIDMSKKVSILDIELYNYRQGRNGAITNIRDKVGFEKNLIQSSTQINLCFKYLKDKYDAEFKDYILNYQASKIIYLLFFIYKLVDFNKKDYYWAYKKYLGNLWKDISIIDVLRSNTISVILKVRYILWKFRLYDMYLKFKLK